MKKSYYLKIGNEILFFKKLESVKKWFLDSGVVDVLLDIDDEVIYDLDNLEYLVNSGCVMVSNECLLERGEEWCGIELGEINFID